MYGRNVRVVEYLVQSEVAIDMQLSAKDLESHYWDAFELTLELDLAEIGKLLRRKIDTPADGTARQKVLLDWHALNCDRHNHML